MITTPVGLAGIQLLQNLTAHEAATIAGHYHYRTLKAGEVLLHEQNSSEFVYLLIEGIVRVFTDISQHRDVTLAFCGVGELFGEMSALDETRHSASVAAVQKCHCLCFDKVAFRQSLKTMPTLSFNVSCLLAERVRRLTEQTRTLATVDARGRLAYHLVLLARRFGQDVPQTNETVIPFRLTQNDFIQLAGTSRSAASPILASFEHSGYIRHLPNHRFSVCNENELVKLFT